MAEAAIPHRFIRLAAHAVGRQEAEDRVLRALNAAGVTVTRSQLAQMAYSTLPLNPPTTFTQLVGRTMSTGEVPGLDVQAWVQSQRHLAVANETDVEGIEISLGTGPRSSPPMSGPGYHTNDVVSDVLDSVLTHRREVAELSHFGEAGFRPCFRSYIAYLLACVTAIDGFLNRHRWFGLNDPNTHLSEAAKKEMKNVAAPLDQKLRRWVPALSGGRVLDESGPPWAEYTTLRVTRNGYTHVNEPDHRFELRPAADILNKCRLGVGQLLIDLADLFAHAPAPAMYRVRYAHEAAFVSKSPAGPTPTAAGPPRSMT